MDWKNEENSYRILSIQGQLCTWTEARLLTIAMAMEVHQGLCPLSRHYVLRWQHEDGYKAWLVVPYRPFVCFFVGRQ